MPPFTYRLTAAFELIKSIWLRKVLYLTRPIMSRLLPDPYTQAGNVRVASKPAHESRVTMTEIIAHHHCNTRVIVQQFHDD